MVITVIALLLSVIIIYHYEWSSVYSKMDRGIGIARAKKLRGPMHQTTVKYTKQ